MKTHVPKIFDSTGFNILLGAVIAVTLFIGINFALVEVPILKYALGIALSLLFVFQVGALIYHFVRERNWEALIGAAFLVTLVVAAYMWDKAHLIGQSGADRPYHPYVYKPPKNR